MNNSLFHNRHEKSNRILYTPAIFAKNSLIYLQETGELKSIESHISKRTNLQSFLFFIVLKGNGKMTYNNQEYRLSAGNCIFIDCRNEYCHQASENGWTLKWIHFNGNTMADIYRKYIKQGGKNCFKSSFLADYEQIIDEIYSIASSEIKIRDMKLYEKLVSVLTLLMSECYESSENEDNTDGARDLTPVKKYIDEHYTEKISLDELAEKFYINKFYLARLFKKQFGMSIVSYLLHIRITHAKQLLRFTDLSVEIIGAECGFSNVNYFSRTFKKIEGLTPGQFRKIW